MAENELLENENLQQEKVEEMTSEEVKNEEDKLEEVQIEGIEVMPSTEPSLEMVKGWKKSAWKAYNFMGIALGIFFMASTVLQLINKFGIRKLIPETIISETTFTLLNVIIPLHIVGFALYFLITLGREKKVPEKHSMKFGQFLVAILLMAGACGIGAVIGTIVNAVLVLLLSVGGTPVDTGGIANLMMESGFLMRVLVVGISAPIVEEMIFRKILIDRVLKYGELAAILISGLFFGMFHGNFTQVFFATMIGMLFALIYVRTGHIWYTIGLHMVLNLTTSVLTIPIIKPFMQKATEPMYLSMASTDPERYLLEVMPSMLVTLLWIGVLGTFVTAGIVFWIITLVKKKIFLKKQECQVKGGFWIALGTVGSILFLLTTIGIFCYQYGSVFVTSHFR